MKGKRFLKSWPEEWPDVTFTRRKRQRYIRLRIYPDRIAVSAPVYCSLKEMEGFVHSQEDHITKSLIRLRKREENLEAIVRKHANQMLLRGVWKKLRPAERHSGNESTSNGNGLWRFVESDQTVYFYPSANTDKYPDKIAQLAYYRSLADGEIKERFYKVTQGLPFKYNRVFIRSQKTRWGTCSSKKNLSFNWRLIKCPHWVWDYLFIHELCHTVHMDHSTEFWSLVNHYYPNLEEARAWIRKNESLIFSEV